MSGIYKAKQPDTVADYAGLRAYAGRRDSVQVLGMMGAAAPSGIAGLFVRHDGDTESADNGGTVIVSANGARWKRQYSGMVDVRWFGAVADGKTDATAAIQAAINSLGAAGGQIYLPGKYLISQTLTTPVRVWMVGDGGGHVSNGASASQITKAASLQGPAIKITQHGSSVERITIQGLAGNGGDGIQISAARVTVRDVGVYSMGGNGIRVGTDTGGENCNLWLLENVKSKANGASGLYVSEGPGALADANGGMGIHLDLQSNTLDGIYLGGAQLNTFFNPVLQNNGQYGIQFGPEAKYNCMFGGDIEANGAAQVRLNAGAEFNAIYCYTITKAMISDSATVSNNRIECIDHNRIVSGLKFPPTQVVSTDPNTLDDYEEGTFAPVIAGATAPGVGAYTTQSGRYTKIGRVVNFVINVASSSHTGTGNTEITGLPFLSDAASGYLTPVTIMQSGGPAPGAGNTRIAYVAPGTNKIVLREQVQATGAIANTNAIVPAAAFYISGEYTVP